MDAGKRTINDIFNENRILEIPFFQRAYDWGDEQWERLLEDMEHINRKFKDSIVYLSFEKEFRIKVVNNLLKLK